MNCGFTFYVFTFKFNKMMCGIAGIYNLKAEKETNFDRAVKMRDYLTHRGPDDCGIYFSADKRLCLVNTRLSIIDLTSLAHQPMSDREGKVWISYNGEIYNYRQLQNELKEKDYSFRSNSDTEVVINGYKEWGIDGLLKRLRGMFAFAIYDLTSASPRFILTRDRFGIKPLYYYQDDTLLIFSSEVGAMVKSGIIPFERNHKADIAFFIFGYIPAPLTTLKNVFSLPVGSYLLIEDGKKRLVKYYDPIDSFTKAKIKDAEDIYSSLRSILAETVNLHLISDAPLGVFLSGGIDSSALVALASKTRVPITTLSIIFDEAEYSELPYQKMIAERYRSDHRQIKVTQKDFYAELENIFTAMDQPTVDGVNTYFVSRAAKQAGLKAVLSGLGGDEIFCGYESFKKIRLLKAINRLPKILRPAFALTGGLNDRWRKLNYLQKDGHLALYLAIRGLFAPKDVEKILGVSEKEIKEVMDNFQLSTINYQL
ncbi:MAG: asparagine synthase (glutamine-hydrolyzing) [Candidatus Omnitrophota bacterium]|nr:asparagine synthase (glutamine-hydrolyzing) [Candidatus Omnitrophota bacterium]